MELNPYTPITDLQNSHTLLAYLGSFWSDIFNGRELLAAKLHTEINLNQQLGLDFLETVASLSRLTVPVYHSSNWGILRLLESDLNSAQTSPMRYGQATTFGSLYEYGSAADTTNFRFPLPTGVAAVSQLVDRLISPTIVLTQGIDYVVNLQDRYIEFVVNPFNNPAFITAVTTDNIRQLTLFMSGTKWDWRLIEEQFGYALGLYAKNSDIYYRELVNAYWDALLEGPAVINVLRGIAATCKLPITNTLETVEALLPRPDSLQVITDKQVHTLPAGSTPTAAIGDILPAGSLLSDAIQVYENSDIDGILANITAISIGKDFCSLPLKGNLTFQNKEYVIQYLNDAEDQFPTVNFQGVEGYDEDVYNFWAHADEEGRRTGNSLAKALRRIAGTDQPREDELVSTVNPAKFLLEQVFRSGLWVVVVKTDQLGAGADLRQLGYIRQILPINAAIIFSSVTQTDAESYNGYTESVTVLDSQRVATETVNTGSGYGDLTVRGYLIEV